jgi:hypothetical protein
MGKIRCKINGDSRFEKKIELFDYNFSAEASIGK